MSKKILIVEDEADMRDALAEVLTQAGFTVTQAENGEVGLATALSEHPDLILLDVIMPIMNGQEMLGKLREDVWGQHAKVVMLTSMDDAQNVAGAYSGNVADYFVKAHIDFDEFVKQVRILLYSA